MSNETNQAGLTRRDIVFAATWSREYDRLRDQRVEEVGEAGPETEAEDAIEARVHAGFVTAAWDRLWRNGQ